MPRNISNRESDSDLVARIETILWASKKSVNDIAKTQAGMSGTILKKKFLRERGITPAEAKKLGEKYSPEPTLTYKIGDLLVGITEKALIEYAGIVMQPARFPKKRKGKSSYKSTLVHNPTKLQDAVHTIYSAIETAFKGITEPEFPLKGSSKIYERDPMHVKLTFYGSKKGPNKYLIHYIEGGIGG